MSGSSPKAPSSSHGQPAASASPILESYNLLQEAEQLRQQGKFERARTICESLLRRYPDYVGALHTLGLVLADREHHQEALDYLVRAAMLNPRNWTTLTALSGVYLRLGAHEMAAQTLEQARSIKPQDSNVLLMLGDVYREDSEYERARDAYREAAALDHTLAPAAIELGWCDETLGEYAESAKVFEGLIKRGMRLLEPVHALATLPASVVGIDLLAQLDQVLEGPSEDKGAFETSLAFVRASALERAGRHAEAWGHLVPANRTVFRAVEANARRLAEARRSSLAVLRAHSGKAGRRTDGSAPISLFILGPSRSGKTTMEQLVSTLDGVKRGYENPIVENAVRRTFQTSALPTGSLLEHLPPQLYSLFRELYTEDLARRSGSAKVFTNTLANRNHDTARMVDIIPNVRFVFLKRDVEDNMLRIYMRKYRSGNPYAYDLKATRDHILWYHQVMDLMAEKFPEIVRVIGYDDMIVDPAAVLRTAAELCGLPIPAGPSPTLGGDRRCAVPYRDFINAELAH
jgi:tetratricopeptide (TPR) repeat protein